MEPPSFPGSLNPNKSPRFGLCLRIEQKIGHYLARSGPELDESNFVTRGPGERFRPTDRRHRDNLTIPSAASFFLPSRPDYRITLNPLGIGR